MALQTHTYPREGCDLLFYQVLSLGWPWEAQGSACNGTSFGSQLCPAWDPLLVRSSEPRGRGSPRHPAASPVSAPVAPRLCPASFDSEPGQRRLK